MDRSIGSWFLAIFIRHFLAYLKNLKKENYNLRFQKKNGQLEKTGRIRQVKKDIARLKTKINEEILEKENAKKNT